MNEDTIQQVGKLTDVNPNDLKKKGLKKKISLVYYYLIQFAFFVVSSLGGLVLGLAGTDRTAYPHVIFSQRYIYGPLILFLTHGSNIGLSYQLDRKKRLIMKKSDPKVISPSYIYPAIVLNIILSTISLFSIYNILIQENIFSTFPMYGVFYKVKSKKLR